MIIYSLCEYSPYMVRSFTVHDIVIHRTCYDYSQYMLQLFTIHVVMISSTYSGCSPYVQYLFTVFYMFIDPTWYNYSHFMLRLFIIHDILTANVVIFLHLFHYFHNTYYDFSFYMAWLSSIRYKKSCIYYYYSTRVLSSFTVRYDHSPYMTILTVRYHYTEHMISLYIIHVRIIHCTLWLFTAYDVIIHCRC